MNLQFKSFCIALGTCWSKYRSSLAFFSSNFREFLRRIIIDSYKISQSDSGRFYFLSFLHMKISIYNPRENAYDEIRILHTEAHPKAMDETRRKFRTVISENQSHIDIDKNHRFPLPKEVREKISRNVELILFLANQSNGRMVVTEWGIKQ